LSEVHLLVSTGRGHAGRGAAVLGLVLLAFTSGRDQLTVKPGFKLKADAITQTLIVG
jgi:hypothetical protein